MADPVEGGELIEVVELDQQFCNLVYGETPCTAQLGTTGDEKCRNTFGTCQDTANYDPGTLTLTFVKNQSQIPKDAYYFPSLRSISHTPSRLNAPSDRRSSPLGKRAKMQATFVDHPHTDRVVDKYAEERITGAAQNSGVGFDPLDKGTMWGKWRARNLFYFGSDIRTKVAVQDPIDFTALTTRHFVVEKISGPGAGNQITITAKDPLKLADDERAKAPDVSTGELSASINDTDTSATLAPAGIGNSEYPSSGTFKVSIGKEIMSCTRSGDTISFSARGEDGTTAESHDAEDTVQVCLEYTGEDAATIVEDLLTTYANISASFIPTSDWNDEVSNFLPGRYTTVIPKPVGVKKLIGELSEQAGFAIWWDEEDQEIKLSAVKPPTTSALTINDDQIIEGSLSIKDNLDARISQVWTSFGQISKTEELDDENNYRSTLVTIDADASSANEYGQDSIMTIFSRWLGANNKSGARSVNNRLLARYRDIIKDVSFRLPSYRADEVKMGQSHNLETIYNQDENGDPLVMPMIILSVEPDGDELVIEAEEFRFDETFVDPENPTLEVELPAGNSFDINFRTEYDKIWGPPDSGTDVKCIIPANAVVGSEIGGPSFDVGTWSDYTFNSLTVEIEGRIAGQGGDGGDGDGGQDGVSGKTAFYTRQAIDVTNNGVIAGGGGGGAGLESASFGGVVYVGGGGGAGLNAGAGGQGNDPNGDDGDPGTLTAGGTGGSSSLGDGGDGGDPAQAGESSVGGTQNGTGGAAGTAIDGDSFVTLTGTGTVTGSQVN